MADTAQTYDGKTFQELLGITEAVLKRHAEIERVRAADVDSRMDCRQSEF
jgi:hypothetical protein